MTPDAAIGTLQVSQRILAPSDTLNSSYDMAITTVSWEKRAITAGQLLNTANAEVVILHFESDRADIKAKKELGLVEMQSLFAPNNKIVNLPSSRDFESSIRVLERLIAEIYGILRRPLKLLIDMTCLPKRYILFLLALGINREFVSRFDFLYSEGNYESPALEIENTNIKNGIISEGDWNTIRIPYFEGVEFIPRIRDLFISAGAEFIAARSYIEFFDPNQLALYIVSNNEKLMSRVGLRHEQRALEELKRLPATQTSAFDVADIVGLAKAILGQRKNPTTCLSIGPKPHALSVGIAGIADRQIEVLCRIPTNYSAISVEPTGRIFHYRVEDRFEPSSYLHP